MLHRVTEFEALEYAMPTLFRLLTVLGCIAAVAYGAMFAIASIVQPQQREIVATVALPQDVELHSGRSAAQALDSQAKVLVRGRRRAQ